MKWNGIYVSALQFNHLTKFESIIKAPEQFGVKSMRENKTYLDILDDIENECDLSEDNEPSLFDKKTARKVRKWLEERCTYNGITI